MKVMAYEGIVENGCIRLPPDVHLPDKAQVYVVVPGTETPRTFHIRSPRLANREDVKDFVLEVIPESGDTKQ